MKDFDDLSPEAKANFGSREVYERIANRKFLLNPVKVVNQLITHSRSAETTINKMIVAQIKEKGVCRLCGSKENLTFHHRIRALKINNVSTLVYTASVAILLEEIAKCDLICDDCHKGLHQISKD